MIYIALGDSISIDDYPDQELGSKGNGAATLLAGHMLRRLHITGFVNCTADGASIADVMRRQLPRVQKYRKEEVVITITMGGNDISFNSMRLKNRNVAGVLFRDMMTKVQHDYVNGVCEIRRQFPNSLLILNTLYDPTDGTGLLPESCGMWAEIGTQYSYGRRQLGQFIYNWGRHLNFAVVADIFKLFDGLGMADGNRLDMYYNKFMIEPGFVGARKIARLWLQAYESSLAVKPETCENNDRSPEAASERDGVCSVHG